MFGSGSIFDPFYLPEEVSPKISFKNARTKTLTDPRGSESTLTFIVTGQSLASNVVDTVPGGTGAFYTPTNPTKIDHINIFDGGTYRATEPLLGTSDSRGNLFFQLADKVIAAGLCQRVILAPIAMGATSITEHVPGTIGYSKLVTAARRCIAAGRTPDAVLLQIGETDAANGMSQATFQANFNLMHAAFDAEFAGTPWFLAKSSNNNATIRAAITALVNGTDILNGADCDAFMGATYRYDSVHPNPAGADSMSTAWLAALGAYF